MVLKWLLKIDEADQVEVGFFYSHPVLNGWRWIADPPNRFNEFPRRAIPSRSA